MLFDAPKTVASPRSAPDVKRGSRFRRLGYAFVMLFRLLRRIAIALAPPDPPSLTRYRYVGRGQYVPREADDRPVG